MKSEAKPKNPKPAAVQSIYRAAGILNCLGNRLNSMTEIASACKLSNSTVHRLLQALEDSSLVIQDPITHKYYFGDLITRLVSDIQIPHEYLIMVAREYLPPLAEKTAETISLAVLVGQQYNTLFEIPSQYKLRVVEAGTNTVEPVNPQGAAGKVLLSQLSDRELGIRVRNLTLTHQLGDIEAYIQEVKNIRLSGYSISQDRVIAGAICLSAPVTHYISPAAVSLYGPRERVKPHIESYIRLLMDSVQAISRRLADTLKARQ